MKVMVTGATGFIGSRLALRLKELDAQVYATGQCNTPAEQQRLAELQKAGIALTICPLQNMQALRSLVPANGIVIHLAAAQHEANVSDAYFREVNVEGTRTLLELSRDAGVRRFVYGSTIGVYGGIDPPLNGAGMLSEATPPSPQNAYSRSKLQAEQIVSRFAPHIEVCIVRISETYGPSDMRMLKLFKAIDHGRFVMIGAGHNRHQPIHVGDVVEGLLAAATHPRAAGETVVIAGGELVTTRELVDNVAAALGRPSPRLRLPLLPFVGAAVALETSLRPLGIQPPLHRRRLDFFRKSFAFSTDKARQLLGFKPQHDLRSGTADTARWYRTHGFLQESRP